MPYLLDVNVLIARSDPDHEFHVQTTRRLMKRSRENLLLCPITENGFLRIFGHPRYPHGPGSPSRAAEHLAVLRRMANVQFVPDSLSISDRSAFPTLDSCTPKQLTDLYLIGLATSFGARFVTFDGRIPAHLVPGGDEATVVIDTA